jgi:ABC-2 type transport system permease protein
VTEANAIAAIAYRDLLKFLRDRTRMVSTFIFPLVFIGALGGGLQASFGLGAGFNLLAFTFSGVLAQTLFQTTAFGLISLIEDRDNDFTQEVFVSPISRYSIVVGKIIGETLVALPQALVILVFGAIMGIPFGWSELAAFLPAGILACLLGGAFGLVVLANLNSQRAANQVFPFIILPQYFLAGVFNPIANLPPFLDVLSRISPLRYPVDLVRGVLYQGNPDYAYVVLAPPAVNAVICAAMFVVFVVIGTASFVRRERNR